LAPPHPKQRLVGLGASVTVFSAALIVFSSVPSMLFTPRPLY
jgi:hypothetical protein